MDNWGTSILMMILGAFLGSIISPASEMFIANKFSKNGPTYNIGNGLILLSAANAAWVISFILFGIANERKSISALGATFALYLIAAILLIASFSQFKKSKEITNQDSTKFILMFIALGNLMWLVGESSEVILRLIGLGSLPHLWIKYAMFAISAILFSWGIASVVKSGKLDINKGSKWSLHQKPHTKE